MKQFILLLLCIAFTITSCKESKHQENSDLHNSNSLIMYSNGDIVTMDGETPNYVEAVVSKDGKIVFVGTEEEANKNYSEATQYDLQGKTMLPGFIDGHSHFSFGINAAMQADVSVPPVGTVTDYNSLIQILENFRQEHQVAEGDWLLASGYDPTELEEKEHITKVELDEAFPNHKVMLIHVSGHGAVLNSKALEWAGIDENTETPDGGVIARMEGSNEPAGLLFETAYLPVFSKLPKPTEEEMLEVLDDVQQIYASEGYTHAQDGAAHIDEYLFLQKAADQNKLYIDIATLGVFMEVDQFLGNPDFIFRQYDNHLKLQGIKMVQDGSPQGKTAYMTKPFLTNGPDGEENWYGEPMMPKQDFINLFKKVSDKKIQIYVHANGDAAIDDVITAVKTQNLSFSDDHRTVVIHSQFQRPDHLPDYKALGISPSYFTNHTFFWGDEHIANQGMERASFISPLNSADQKGIVFSNHSDFNVTPTNARFMLWTAITRTTRSGKILGKNERVDAYTALKGLTTGPAYQLFEEDRKGMIKENLLADFVILDQNPLKVDPDSIKDINIIETIKEGKSIFKKK